MENLGIKNLLNMHDSYKDIYERYIDDASFLWILRSIAIEQPHYNASDILELEQRIEAQLDGLMTSLDVGWGVCESALELQEPGEVFSSMVIAMRSHESDKIKISVNAGFSNERAVPGLVSAMGWLPDEIAIPWTDRFLNGKDLNHKYLGLASCSIRRKDPGEILTKILQREDCRQHEKLYCRALRLIGELRRQDCMPAINAAMNVDNENINFWANWSAILLGHRNCVENLHPHILQAGPYQDMAIQVAFRTLPLEQAREWISQLSKDSAQGRPVIKAIAVLGDPHAVNWLINKMQDPKLAKIAGEAFSSITGVNIEKSQLAIDKLDKYQDIPSDESDDSYTDLDDDENLPYPNFEKVADIWRKHGQNFIVGRRYFGGRPIRPEILKDTLMKGSQRQRHAAAIELALSENDVPLPNTRARVLAP